METQTVPLKKALRSLSQNQREEIASKLRQYREEQGVSQEQVAEAAGVNKAYVNRIENNLFAIEHAGKKATPIADNHFEAIARVVGYAIEAPIWQHFNTQNFKRIIAAFEEARQGDLRAIDGNTGYGKSYAAKRYLQVKRRETYVVKASDDLTVKGLTDEIAQAVGVSEGGNRTQVRKAIVKKLRQMEQPLLIFDEAENLSDNAWKAVKTFIDDLENEHMGSARRYLCGIVVMGMDIHSCIVRKAAKNMGVYPQIERRFSSSWRHLWDLTSEEITEVAQSLGVQDKGAVRWLQHNIRNYGSLSRLISRALLHTERSGSEVSAGLFEALMEN